MNVLSIVMPVYNERNEIGGALIRIEEIMRKEKYINE